MDVLKSLYPFNDKLSILTHVYGEKIAQKKLKSKKIVNLDASLLKEIQGNQFIVMLFYVQWDSLYDTVLSTLQEVQKRDFSNPILFCKVETDLEFELMSQYGFVLPTPSIGISKTYGKTIDSIYTGNIGNVDDLYFWIQQQTEPVQLLNERKYNHLDAWRKLLFKTNTVFLLGTVSDDSMPKLVKSMFLKASKYENGGHAQFFFIDKSKYTSETFWTSFSSILNIPLKLMESTQFELIVYNVQEQKTYRYGYNKDHQAISPESENEVNYRHILIPEWINLKIKPIVHQLNPYTIQSLIPKAAYTVIMWSNYTNEKTNPMLHEQFISLARQFEDLAIKNQYEDHDIATQENLIFKGSNYFDNPKEYYRLFKQKKLVQFGTFNIQQYQTLYERMFLPHLQQINPLSNGSSVTTKYPSRMVVYQQESKSIQILSKSFIENDWIKKQDAKKAIQASIDKFIPYKRSQSIDIQPDLPHARHISYADLKKYENGVVFFHKYYCAACLPAKHAFIQAISQLDDKETPYLIYDVRFNDIPPLFSIQQVPLLIKFKKGHPVDHLRVNLENSEFVQNWLSTS
mmetsp:Transcript_7575/g.11246  ORF Transcript_7575/g.11246 Transcript_7575/m.11246 type:complete len:572 (+) Transcript_7575:1-1716(+)